MPFIKQKGTNVKQGVCLLAAHNDMTIYAAAENHSSVVSFYSQYKKFYIDLSKVEEIDTTGLQVLLSLSQSAKTQNKDVFLHSPSDMVSDVFNVFGVKEHFTWKKFEKAS